MNNFLIQKGDIPSFQDENVSGLAFEVNFSKNGFCHSERKYFSS